MEEWRTEGDWLSLLPRVKDKVIDVTQVKQILMLEEKSCFCCCRLCNDKVRQELIKMLLLMMLGPLL